jgi:hypothetical protein
MLDKSRRNQIKINTKGYEVSGYTVHNLKILHYN